MDLALDRPAQQPVPRGIELDLIDPVAVPIVGEQDRDVALGPPPMLEPLDAAGHRAGLARPVEPPAATLARQTLAQSEIDLEQVDRLQWRHLVENLARRVTHLGRAHALSQPAPKRPL